MWRYVEMLRRTVTIAVSIACIMIAGCVAPNVKLFTDATDPLKEYVLEGEAKEKILIISIKGVITDLSKKGMLQSEPSMVQDIVSQLRLAEKDPDIKAVVFTIDSPGGSVTASDILYHEIMKYKEKTGAKVTAVLMNVAASGGYYVALPADRIFAHPTSITGSIGVIFLRPKVYGLMEKIGVDVAVSTSGQNKDMGSPFREATEEEKEIFQTLTDSLGSRFSDLVLKHRQIDPEKFEEICSARIYLAQEAKDRGLVDEVGYVGDALTKTKNMAGVPEDAKVVVFRRNEYPNDNIYNTQTQLSGSSSPLVNLGLPDLEIFSQPGFYYLWPAGLNGER
jgi:protease IV